MLISFITQFFGLPTLAGIIILSRFVSRTWQLVIGIVLVVVGLVVGATQ